MKFLYVLTLLVAGASCFSFKTQNGWYNSSEVNYRLKELPNTLIVNCDSSHVKCSALDSGLFYNNAVQWLLQHWNELKVVDGRACRISGMGPAIMANFSCEMYHVKDPWSDVEYDAKRCRLELYNTLGVAPVTWVIVIATVVLFYLSTVACALYIERSRKQMDKRLQSVHPKLRAALSIQIMTFIFINLVMCLMLSNYYSLNNICSCENFRDDVAPFTLSMIGYSFVLTPFICLVAVSTVLKYPHEEEEEEYFVPVKRSMSI